METFQEIHGQYQTSQNFSSKFCSTGCPNKFETTCHDNHTNDPFSLLIGTAVQNVNFKLKCSNSLVTMPKKTIQNPLSCSNQ